MEEQWETVVVNGEVWERYEVSNKGRVRNKKTGRILKPYRSGKKGNKYYLKVRLCYHGQQKQAYVHRLVAEVYIPNPNNYETVDHINHDKHDNRVENLRWLTAEENSKDGAKISVEVRRTKKQNNK